MNKVATNKAIAEFMCVEFNKDGDKCQHPLIIAPWTPVECLQYDTNWYWLMPVVEKISVLQIGDGIETVDYAYPRTFCMPNEETGKTMVRLNGFQSQQADTLIEATYLAVSDFIEWYNKQEK